ncbi:hypothetical protein [Butyrivibrio fibrisolvens]|uniref:hypothetical protein n=1 Tax=Butyrivibrio fibrisolvens TaxID=831 RepID=UPI0006878F5C|nr:hypothetical protein [Butyrivibrio fibrisolvens]
MCGILGAYRCNIEPERFGKCLDLLSHRGPDGFGIWTSDDNICQLGHRRLAIIDLSDRSKQPMTIGSRYTIVFNGEIYNYLELKVELKKKGYCFKSSGDAEVVFDFVY